MRWVTITEIGRSPSGKTGIFVVCPTVPTTVLGYVQWFAPWRKYAFMPATQTVFEEDCLRDIASFCEETTRAHRAARKQRVV